VGELVVTSLMELVELDERCWSGSEEEPMWTVRFLTGERLFSGWSR